MRSKYEVGDKDDVAKMKNEKWEKYVRDTALVWQTDKLKREDHKAHFSTWEMKRMHLYLLL